MPFSSLGLSQPLLQAVTAREYVAPTPIQVAAIPVILSGADVQACAQPGSGKTAAYALPLLQRLLEHSRAEPRRSTVLVLAPTRELALQIAVSFSDYAKYFPDPIKIAALFGGVSINPQLMALRGGAEIIVSTPGRLLDVIAHNALRLSAVSTCVLDEADKLLDLGFDDELSRVLALLPARHQTLLFSATFPESVKLLAERLLRDPIHVEIGPSVTTDAVLVQRAISVGPAQRTQLLRHLVETHGWEQVLVFVATKYATEHVAAKLRRHGINAAPFHGDLSQGARTTTLADFKGARLQVLVTTDITARGIDIAQLPAVVNYDLPRSAVDYLHRIGRTGRSGATGIAVSFVSAHSEAHFALIEKRHGLLLPRERIAGFEPPDMPALTAAEVATGGIKGRRKSKKDKLREAANVSLVPQKKPVWELYAKGPKSRLP
ncbi:MAG: DEAD/DEAH box helicase [Gammaproteobacteria bacterium]|nr:DEAD/DEAH box helicase [Gammaproteobacteria bacterium]